MSRNGNANTTKSISIKMKELEEMVEWFDGKDFTPELAVEKFRAAEQLARNIETELTTVKNEIIVIKNKFSKG